VAGPLSGPPEHYTAGRRAFGGVTGRTGARPGTHAAPAERAPLERARPPPMKDGQAPHPSTAVTFTVLACPVV
jgi:hypothetical protein